VANIVPDIDTFTCTKPVGMMPTKATGENELKRKELKLKQLKGKEDEAARKCEESFKAKEQKRFVHLFTLFVTSAGVLI
jgi:hypothetical protein